MGMYCYFFFSSFLFAAAYFKLHKNCDGLSSVKGLTIIFREQTCFIRLQKKKNCQKK